MEKVKVAIADDHPAIRSGVRRVLEQLPGIEVVGEAEDGQEAVEIVEEAAPDLLILDMQMPVMDGVEVIEALQQSGLEVTIVVLSAIDDPAYIDEVLSRGACLFIIKGDIPDLIKAVQQAWKGKCQKDQGQSSTKMNANVY